jgi:hypothetical protein
MLCNLIESEYKLGVEFILIITSISPVVPTEEVKEIPSLQPECAILRCKRLVLALPVKLYMKGRASNFHVILFLGFHDDGGPTKDHTSLSISPWFAANSSCCVMECLIKFDKSK